MRPAELLRNFMPGDVIVEVQDDPENDSGLIVVFESGYRLVCGSKWRWELPRSEAPRPASTAGGC